MEKDAEKKGKNLLLAPQEKITRLNMMFANFTQQYKQLGNFNWK